MLNHHPQATVADCGLFRKWHRSSQHSINLPVYCKEAVF